MKTQQTLDLTESRWPRAQGGSPGFEAHIRAWCAGPLLLSWASDLEDIRLNLATEAGHPSGWVLPGLAGLSGGHTISGWLLAWRSQMGTVLTSWHHQG